jgi:hypothetical protein
MCAAREQQPGTNLDPTHSPSSSKLLWPSISFPSLMRTNLRELRASRGEIQPVAAVRAAGTPPNRDQVAFGNEAVDVNRDVPVRVAVCGMEMFELRGLVQIGA